MEILYLSKQAALEAQSVARYGGITFKLNVHISSVIAAILFCNAI